MTVQELYDRQNDGSSKPTPYRYYIGFKVRHKVYVNGVEYWSSQVFTIEDHNSNVCGDGCCHGFTLKGIDDTVFWADQLKLEEVLV